MSVYANWLVKIDPLYAGRLEVIQTGGRNDLDRALPALGCPPEAFALRDRDEWDAGRIAAAQSAAANLLVNPARHCLESYFCDPDELIAVLLAKDAAKYSPAEPALRAALGAPLPDWVDHWSMWTTAMRLQGDMVSAGYVSHYHDVLPLPPDADIQARLDSWGTLASRATVWASFDSLRIRARTGPNPDKHRSCVHGKKFWDRVVHPALLAAEKRTDWLIDLADWSPIPPDLNPLLRTVLP